MREDANPRADRTRRHKRSSAAKYVKDPSLGQEMGGKIVFSFWEVGR